MISFADETPADVYQSNLALARLGSDALQERLKALGSDPVGAFLQHVLRTVPFYQRLGGKCLTDNITSFPIIERATMVACRPEFLSADYQSESELLYVNTNATLGTKLKVSFDLAGFYDVNHSSFARILATRPHLSERLKPQAASIYLINDQPDWPITTMCLPSLGGTLLRRLPFYRGPSHDQALAIYLRARTVPILYGKPHVLLELSEVDSDIGPPSCRISPDALLVMAENLYPSDRVRLENWYRCEIINAYTATEAGLIAVECPRGLGLHVQADRLRLEVLTEEGMAEEGDGDLVITNVMNWGQAFVRYMIGDYVSLHRSSCLCGHNGPTISRLAGRDEQQFVIPGRGTLATADLEVILNHPNVKQYEVGQSRDGHITVRWIPTAQSTAEHTDRYLSRQLAAVIGPSFSLVRTGAITPKVGGKLRRFIKT